VSEAYASESRQSLEEKWILDYLPLVRHIVSKVSAHLPRKEDSEDLISAGTLGLVKAAKAFDPSRDADFKTYAYIRIRGAVIDELRGRSFAPAGVHSQVRRIREAYRSYTARHGQPPVDEELAAELGIALPQLYRTLEETRRQHFLSIHGLSDDRPVPGALVPVDDSPSPQSQAERKEMLEQLAKAILELPQRDRTILLLYYERDLTMKEAAQVLDLTESRVSQLHASALFKLSMKLRSSS
jgi:RNA polymerase sigma factor for flagellar operon FliA